MDVIWYLLAVIVAWFLDKVLLTIWSILDAILWLIRATAEQRCFAAHVIYVGWMEANLKQIQDGTITDRRTIEWLKRFHLRNFERLQRWQCKVRGLEPSDL